MVPALFIAALITIIAPFIECQHWSGGLTSALNACIALLISLSNYLKLESSTEMYLQMSNHYDRLETTLEISNGKLLFIEKDSEKMAFVLNKMSEIENKIMEIKESNTILLPEEVKPLFPIICHINIFSFIKKIEMYRKTLLLKFRDVKNEIRYILYKWESRQSLEMAIHSLANHSTNSIVSNAVLDSSMVTCDVGRREPVPSQMTPKEASRLHFLYEIKEKLKIELIEFRSIYSYIDEIITKEIKCAERTNLYWCFFCRHVNVPPPVPCQHEVINKYIQFIFEDTTKSTHS
jgi:hypothetical protein